MESENSSIPMSSFEVDSSSGLKEEFLDEF